ncbi:hypothetical protein Hanom_Chr01g00071001 [Helianthus anomalus]
MSPKFFEEDQVLSVVRVGVLVGEAQRIHEVVSLKCKNKFFRVWVEEEQDVWTPDCVGSPVSDVSGGSSSTMMSSPVIGKVGPDQENSAGEKREGGTVRI